MSERKVISCPTEAPVFALSIAILTTTGRVTTKLVHFKYFEIGRLRNLERKDSSHWTKRALAISKLPDNLPASIIVAAARRTCFISLVAMNASRSHKTTQPPARLYNFKVGNCEILCIRNHLYPMAWHYLTPRCLLNLFCGGVLRIPRSPDVDVCSPGLFTLSTVSKSFKPLEYTNFIPVMTVYMAPQMPHLRPELIEAPRFSAHSENPKDYD